MEEEGEGAYKGRSKQEGVGHLSLGGPSFVPSGFEGETFFPVPYCQDGAQSLLLP